MHGLVLVAFLAWPVLTVLLFRLRPGPGAAFLSLFAGWALLPTAGFPASATGTFDSLTGVALPTRLLVTKATVIGASALLGVLLCDRAAFRRLRPHPLDLVLVAFCLTPPASGIANGTPPGPAFQAAAYLLLAWGSPWLVGRIYLQREAGRRTWLEGLALLGLAYLPFVLTEFAFRPFWYTALYGFHPYATDGIDRYLGYRPIVFLEHGNQLGIWMAVAAVAAFWRWRSEPREAPAAGRRTILPLTLAAATVLCQSAGSIVLLIAGILPLAFRSRGARRTVLVVLLALTGSYIAVRAAGVMPVRVLAKTTRFGQWTRKVLEEAGRGSFGWRLSREEQHLDQAWEHPVLGRGRWDWWRENGKGRPWGLWMLVFGAYGLVGLLLLVLTVLGPVVRHALHTGPAPPLPAATALAVILVLCFADSLLNSTFVVVVVSAAGGLVNVRGSTPATAREGAAS